MCMKAQQYHVSVSVDSRVIVKDLPESAGPLCMVYGERSAQITPCARGDLHSGTLRDGNHKPTIPSAGASGLNFSTHHGVVVPVEFMGGWDRENSVWVS